jgi:hypothetical protein
MHTVAKRRVSSIARLVMLGVQLVFCKGLKQAKVPYCGVISTGSWNLQITQTSFILNFHFRIMMLRQKMLSLKWCLSRGSSLQKSKFYNSSASSHVLCFGRKRSSSQLQVEHALCATLQELI